MSVKIHVERGNPEIFKEIYAFLKRKRNCDVDAVQQDQFLFIDFKNEQISKHFCVTYADFDNEITFGKPRPRWHHYHVSYENENVWSAAQNCLVTSVTNKWCTDCEDALESIKKMLNRKKW